MSDAGGIIPGNTNEKSIDKVNGKHTYGNIAYDTDTQKWLIGTCGATSGWYEGVEPDVENTVSYLFKINPVNDLTTTVIGLLSHTYNTEYSECFYNAYDGTYRITVPDVDSTVGWLEANGSDLNIDLTFRGDTWDRTYNLRNILQGLTPGWTIQDGDIVVIGDRRCSGEDLSRSITFAFRGVPKDNLTITYYGFDFGDNKVSNGMLGEVAIWR